MSEQLLQFIWKLRLFNEDDARTSTGESIKVLSCGTQNTDAGPDFFNAKIKIGNTEWIGNVEIHKNTSDWKKHGHHTNKEYDNVILHVVKNNDGEVITNSSGAPIPIYELQYNTKLEHHYSILMQSAEFVPCKPLVQSIESFKLRHFLTRLAIERMEERSDRINDVLLETKNNWERVFELLLFRSFGFGINSEPFELLAKNTPLSSIAKHRNSLLQLEALLFGQAGMLDANATDEYQLKLQKEYQLLKVKFGLISIPLHTWKFMRTRPTNFPTIRIAQLASLLHLRPKLLSDVLDIRNLDDCIALFSVQPSEHWDTHYTFGKESKKSTKLLGTNSVERIVANLIAPFMFSYGKSKGDEDLQYKALELLEQIEPENNSIVSGWESINIKPINMFESQALIQLKQHYCNKKRCLSCTIGTQVLQE